MDKPSGRTEPIFPSRRHDAQLLLELEACELAWNAEVSRHRAHVVEAVEFLETWWSPAALVPVYEALVRYEGPYSRDREFFRYRIQQDAEVPYDAAELEASPGLRRGLRVGHAYFSAACAFELMSFIGEVLGTGERGPVIARVEKEAMRRVRDAVVELRAIVRDPATSEAGRFGASRAVDALAIVEHLDDPVVAATWSAECKVLMAQLDEIQAEWFTAYLRLPADSPPPAAVTSLYQKILDGRYVPDWHLGGDDELRMAYADAIEGFDPARAVFVRRHGREKPEPRWFENEDDPPRFIYGLRGMQGEVGVGLLSPIDVARWVEPVGPYVNQLFWGRGLISGVEMTLAQLAEHGERIVLREAPIFYLSVDATAPTPELLEVLRTTPAFEPLRSLDVIGGEGVNRDRELLRALFENPHLKRVRRLQIIGGPGVDIDEPIPEEIVELIAANKRNYPELSLIGAALEGMPTLVISRELWERRQFEWEHPSLSDTYSGYMRNETPPEGLDRWEPTALAARLIAEYGPQPWLSHNIQAEQLYRAWWNLPLDRPFTGTPWWRDAWFPR